MFWRALTLGHTHFGRFLFGLIFIRFLRAVDRKKTIVFTAKIL